MKRQPIDMTASQTDETTNQHLITWAIRNMVRMLENPEALEILDDDQMRVTVNKTMWDKYINDRDILDRINSF